MIEELLEELEMKYRYEYMLNFTNFKPDNYMWLLSADIYNKLLENRLDRLAHTEDDGTSLYGIPIEITTGKDKVSLWKKC